MTRKGVGLLLAAHPFVWLCLCRSSKARIAGVAVCCSGWNFWMRMYNCMPAAYGFGKSEKGGAILVQLLQSIECACTGDY